MSKLTIWTCDKCKTEWCSDETRVSPLKQVILSVGPPRSFGTSGAWKPAKDHWSAFWCENCLRKIGIPEPKKDEPAVEPVTLDDMIRDIVHEVIDNQ